MLVKRVRRGGGSPSRLAVFVGVIILAGWAASRYVWPDWWAQFERDPMVLREPERSWEMEDPCKGFEGCVPVYFADDPRREEAGVQGD